MANSDCQFSKVYKITGGITLISFVYISIKSIQHQKVETLARLLQGAK